MKKNEELQVKLNKLNKLKYAENTDTTVDDFMQYTTEYMKNLEESNTAVKKIKISIFIETMLILLAAGFSVFILFNAIGMYRYLILFTILILLSFKMCYFYSKNRELNLFQKQMQNYIHRNPCMMWILKNGILRLEDDGILSLEIPDYKLDELFQVIRKG